MLNHFQHGVRISNFQLLSIIGCFLKKTVSARPSKTTMTILLVCELCRSFHSWWGCCNDVAVIVIAKQVPYSFSCTCLGPLLLRWGGEGRAMTTTKITTIMTIWEAIRMTMTTTCLTHQPNTTISQQSAIWKGGGRDGGEVEDDGIWWRMTAE